jgi:hypothetical protein
MKKVVSSLSHRKNWYCSDNILWAYSPATKGFAARCIAFLAPLLFISWMRHPHYGERNVLNTLIASPKGYRTMLAIHDQMHDRLKTTCMGLGLVRLLQVAKRFEEARTTLYFLENSFQGVAEESDEPSQEPSKANRLKNLTKTASCSSASIRINAAEMLTRPLSIA